MNSFSAPALPPPPALLARDLELAFGRLRVLKGVDLEVHPGDLYGLLGRNGAGKSTTLGAILGFLPQARGRREVFGVPSHRLQRLAVPIGVALDPPGLDDGLSVRQNLELARIRGGIRGGRSVEEVLGLVRLQHRADNRGDRLSHGQGRRAAVARALLGAPELLILDEPLSGLDPEGVEDMLELFLRLTREEGVTVLLSSHHLREVQEVCNRVGLIDDGRVVLEGETAQLLDEAGDGLEIRCARPARARELLSAWPGLLELSDGPEGLLRARLAPGVELAPLLEHLAGAGIGLHAFTPSRASLVDVFRRAVA